MRTSRWHDAALATLHAVLFAAAIMIYVSIPVMFGLGEVSYFEVAVVPCSLCVCVCVLDELMGASGSPK